MLPLDFKGWGSWGCCRGGGGERLESSEGSSHRTVAMDVRGWPAPKDGARRGRRRGRSLAALGNSGVGAGQETGPGAQQNTLGKSAKHTHTLKDTLNAFEGISVGRERERAGVNINKQHQRRGAFRGSLMMLSSLNR